MFQCFCFSLRRFSLQDSAGSEGDQLEEGITEAENDLDFAGDVVGGGSSSSSDYSDGESELTDEEYFALINNKDLEPVDEFPVLRKGKLIDTKGTEYLDKTNTTPAGFHMEKVKYTFPNTVEANRHYAIHHAIAFRRAKFIRDYNKKNPTKPMRALLVWLWVSFLGEA